MMIFQPFKVKNQYYRFFMVKISLRAQRSLR